MPLVALRPSQRLVDLVGALGGRWLGYVAMCRCPAHNDSTPSLSLRQGNRGILVTCFAGCEPGDILRELRRVSPERRYEAPPVSSGNSTANVARLWERGLAIEQGLALRYLTGRSLGIHSDLRFLARCPLGPRPFTVFKPALLVAVREGRSLVALQRIFLDPMSAQYEAKVMLGRPGRGAWQGGIPKRELALAEGFESAAAFQEYRSIPTWAALGARRLDQIQIPPDVQTLILAEDNDAEGRRAAERALDAYRRPGLQILRAPPPLACKDWTQFLAQCRQKQQAIGASP